MKYNFLPSVIVHLCAIYVVANAYNPPGIGGAPGPVGGPGSPGAYRPISPGGSDTSPEGKEDSILIGKTADKRTSPQQPAILGETGVKESSGVAEIVEPAPADGILGYENGVREAETLGENVGCGIALSSGLKVFSPKKTKDGSQMCLELMCSNRCPNGNVMDANGCLTCTCLDIRSRITEACPNTTIQAMWQISSSNEIGLLVGGGLYNMSEGGNIKVSTYKFEQSMHFGGLCGSIDAAFTAELDVLVGREDYTVFFSGDKYSLYKNQFGFVTGPHSIYNNYQSGSKTPLQLSLPRWVKKIDAAMKWRNGKIYLFFKYMDVGYFSKYDPRTGRMYESYPRRTDAWWKGLPKEGPDAAYFSRKKWQTYFTVGRDLYVLKRGRMEVSTGPKSVMDNFIRCTEEA